MAHRATYIEDVVEAIFSHFVLDANLASLSSVARSCQRFQLPALRLLWEDMDFVLLLRLFSNGIIQSGMLRNIGEIEFSRTPDPEDWSRFVFYARFVKCLRIRATDDYNSNLPSRGLMQALALHRPSLIITPNLTKLYFDLRDISLAIPFFSESLTYVAFGGTGLTAETVPSTIRRLAGTSFVTTLFLDDISATLALFMERGFPCLKALVLTCLSRIESFVILSSLPPLQSFYVTFSSRISDNELRNDSSNGRSSSLQSLVLTGEISPMILALSVIQATNVIETLTLRFTAKQPPQQADNFSPLFHTIPAKLPHLRALSIHSSLNRAPSDEQGSLTFDIIQPLTQLKLNSLVFRLPLPLRLTDDELKTFASTWPDISEFKLMTNPLASQPLSFFTMGILQYFAQSFASLRSLGIQVKTDLVASRATSDYMSQSLPSLMILDLGDSSVSSGFVHQTARYLAFLFPKLTKISHTKTEQWKPVDDLVAFALEVRQNEREWLAQLGKLNGIKGA